MELYDRDLKLSICKHFFCRFTAGQELWRGKIPYVTRAAPRIPIPILCGCGFFKFIHFEMENMTHVLFNILSAPKNRARPDGDGDPSRFFGTSARYDLFFSFSFFLRLRRGRSLGREFPETQSFILPPRW